MPEEEDLKWYHLSLCREMKTQWFYEDYENDAVFAGIMDGICLSCPVRKQCLREAVENSEYGLWGGVYLNNGKTDETRNAHKSEDVWEVIRSGLSG